MRIEVYRRWTIYGKQWFWRARSVRNGKIMAVGGEGYFNKADIMESLGMVQLRLPLAEVEVQG